MEDGVWFRHPDTVNARLIVCLCSLSFLLRGEVPFLGGSGQGYGEGYVYESFLNGAPSGVLHLYLGGPGRGDVVAISGRQRFESTQPPEPTFLGGTGDGTTSTVLATTDFNSGQLSSALYQGGAGNGADHLSIYTDLSGSSTGEVMFSGGSGDGFAGIAFAGEASGATNVLLSGTSLGVMFLGGAGDGAVVAVGSPRSLDGTDLGPLWFGGVGDGADLAVAQQTFLEATVQEIFFGGPGDGFDGDPEYGIILSEGQDFDGDLLIDLVDQDDDNDLIPDVWEIRFSLNPLLAMDASSDTDGDGKSSLEEYIADTDPTNAASLFQITLVNTASGLEVHFTSSLERLYQLEQRDSLSPTSTWSPTGSENFGRDGAEVLPVPESQNQRFIRIRVSLP